MVRRVSIGAVLPAAAITTLLATATSPGPVPAAERRPLDDPHGLAGPCSDPWSAAPTLTGDLERLMDIWSPSAAPRPPGRRRQLARPAPKTAAEPPADSQERPNIVLFMVDDMRADEMSGPWLRQTRRLIARQGATFVNSFSPLPLCGPARASFLTGKYAHNTGVRDNVLAFERLDDGNTLPVWLDDAGYTTAFLGKYINGYEGLGSDHGSSSYIPPGWDQWYASISGTYDYRHTVLSDDGKGLINLGGRYQTSAYADIGSRLVSHLASGREPFYLNLSFTAPHTGRPREPGDPAHLPTVARLREMRGAYDDMLTTPGGVPGEPCDEAKPTAVSDLTPISPAMQRQITQARRQRAEALATVDDAIAQVMRSLRRSGELDNTYVIFTSDNGFFLGEFRQRKGKRLPYEPALRTPTIVRGPGIDAGIEREQAFTTIDFAPTIADMAGAKVGANVDGKSLLKAATSKPKPWRRPILTDAGVVLDKDRYGFGVRLPGVFYGEYNDRYDTRELYNLRRDPNELRNLVGTKRHRGDVRKLSKLLGELRGCRGEVCRHPLKESKPGSKQSPKPDSKPGRQSKPAGGGS